MKLEDIWRDTRSCIYQMILIGVLLLTPFPSFSFLGMGQRLYRNWHQCLKYINRCYCLYNDTSSRAQAFRSRSICSPTCTDPTSLWRWNPFGTYGCRMFCCWVVCQHVPGSPRSRAPEFKWMLLLHIQLQTLSAMETTATASLIMLPETINC